MGSLNISVKYMRRYPEAKKKISGIKDTNRQQVDTEEKNIMSNKKYKRIISVKDIDGD